MQGRSAFQPIAGRQRSEPGYLIEGMEPGCWPGGPMGTGALPGFPMMPLSGLEIPPPPPLQLQGSMQHMGGQGPSSRRSTETGSGGRPITLPKRWVLVIVKLCMLQTRMSLAALTASHVHYLVNPRKVFCLWLLCTGMRTPS